ncbi:tRNA1(Val) A37 N6-methylase TrmN6 [Mesorhizobium sp. J18]|uniref:tRNA1(Val) (adenine(37)-N6)-methyltransferase n=1 Tax=Mesorhizobium sp. J18 TaxID=935263 RepID=UPI00119C2D41|nr:methyltransferase [Mesorhizobium sp. J18]TWG89614.1 tRNA1(Val) A37 N6-methylase TrmN6 [Mesorhizobium sp. J18]
MNEAMTEEEVTLDAFHRGAFWLVQPARRGHRAGVDAMMLAAAVPGSFSGRLADLGSGAGAAGFAVVARCRASSVTLVDRSPEMLEFARRSLALEQNEDLRNRIDILEADVTLAGKERNAAGLEDRSFDFAIMNPPFNAGVDRATPDALKRLAHVMDDDLFERWIRTATAIVKPRGGLALIARPGSLHAILMAMAGRFGNAEILPVHPREDAAAIRIVVRARAGARGGLSVRPPLFLHGKGDSFTARADDINNGRASLFGD